MSSRADALHDRRSRNLLDSAAAPQRLGNAPKAECAGRRRPLPCLSGCDPRVSEAAVMTSTMRTLVHSFANILDLPLVVRILDIHLLLDVGEHRLEVADPLVPGQQLAFGDADVLLERRVLLDELRA
jgi:hypothetical protein